ncbi:type II 3-dehydroquinate dehydratase [Roseivirga sp. 4D4]|uniref:type II 3-dehydroquinate dehydratase n=1 Tax=Roseivirga sp. 4D4 TaxID=1889784 RepID=UPI0008529DF5|nr:type II 3-dehydroquinate dehydratase [Roseivirga sp. 4D4]OEK00479.1 type II 3-dehydroquinate dehydratase [Roseivirga sp. 4D4]
MKVIIINGPNLNLLGTREKSIYGDQSFEAYFETLKSSFSAIELEYYQSNVEGELINKLHEVGFSHDGIVFNGGGYTHTSVAISDAIAAIETPVVEVHISNIHAREEFRHLSLITKECAGLITGFGLKGYDMALWYLRNKT